MHEIYGDESATDHFVSYAAVCIRQKWAGNLARSLHAIRQELGLPNLHCRVLFSGDQRKKLGLSHFSTDTICDAYERIIKDAASFDTYIVAAQAQISRFPTVIHADNDFPRMIFDKKTLGIMCANAALLPLAREHGVKNMRVWPDADRTMTEWMGQRTQASRAIGGYYDFAGDDRMTPMMEHAPKDERIILFELADAIAWLSNRAQIQDDPERAKRYSALLDMSFPMKIKVDIHPAGGMGVLVPDKWPKKT